MFAQHVFSAISIKTCLTSDDDDLIRNLGKFDVTYVIDAMHKTTTFENVFYFQIFLIFRGIKTVWD